MRRGCGCKRDRLWVWFRFGEIKYVKLLFPRSGNEVKSGVKFRNRVLRALLVSFAYQKKKIDSHMDLPTCLLLSLFIFVIFEGGANLRFFFIKFFISSCLGLHRWLWKPRNIIYDVRLNCPTRNSSILICSFTPYPSNSESQSIGLYF